MSQEAVFHPNLEERKRILQSIAKNNAKWKLYIGTAIILFLCSLAIIGATGILLAHHQTTKMGIFIFICFGLIIACIPFFIAISLKNKAKYKCALPYSSYANGTLFLKQNEIEYVFWRVSSDEPAAYSSSRAVYRDSDKYTYSIQRQNIKELAIDEYDICRIQGIGRLNAPEWAVLEKKELKEIEKHFSFVLAFNESNAKEVLNDWRKING